LYYAGHLTGIAHIVCL